MGIGNVIRSLRGTKEEEEPAEPSHRCQSCGEEYFTNPATKISTCRACGGINVESIA